MPLVRIHVSDYSFPLGTGNCMYAFDFMLRMQTLQNAFKLNEIQQLYVCDKKEINALNG